MSKLQLENLSFNYSNGKNNFVVNNFNLDVEDGKWVVLLGQSGCGKTTILRLIAGFLNPISGLIKIDSEIQNNILPKDRGIGFVFQDYALFPHLTVKGNLAYGLECKKISGTEKEKQIEFYSELLGIKDLLNRYPFELSGGQQQRVALGRTLVLKPKIILMDEPLSSLDAQLRLKVRRDLKNIQKELNITTVYVTHDREEAFSLADKIAVIKSGSVEQCAPPKEVYYSPANRFVAELSGGVNFININSDTLLVRPEWINILKNNADMASDMTFSGKIIGSEFLGLANRYIVKTKDNVLLCDDFSFNNDFAINEDVKINITKWQKGF